jgi:hypothetical protein
MGGTGLEPVTPSLSNWSSARASNDVLEDFEQLPSNSRREQLCVRALGDVRAGVAEELADRFQSKSPLDEITTECAPQCVGTDGGTILARTRSRTPSGVPVLTCRLAGAGNRPYTGLKCDALDDAPYLVRRQGRATAGDEKWRRRRDCRPLPKELRMLMHQREQLG